MEPLESGTRQATVASVRDKVHRLVGSWLKDEECMQIALSCGTRDPDNLLGFLFNANVARAGHANAGELALTTDEWKSCFGVESRAVREEGLQSVVSNQEFQKGAGKLALALRCTIAEPFQGAVWKRYWSQAAALLSVHSEEPEPLLTAPLGDLVRADLRRLEDLRVETEEHGVETMLLSQLVVGMSRCVS